MWQGDSCDKLLCVTSWQANKMATDSWYMTRWQVLMWQADKLKTETWKSAADTIKSELPLVCETGGSLYLFCFLVFSFVMFAFLLWIWIFSRLSVWGIFMRLCCRLPRAQLQEECFKPKLVNLNIYQRMYTWIKLNVQNQNIINNWTE